MQKIKASKKNNNLILKKRKSSSKRTVASVSKKKDSSTKISKLNKRSKNSDLINLKKVSSKKKKSSNTVIKKKDNSLKIKTIMELKAPINNSKSSFFKDLFGFRGYYKFIWIPIVVLFCIVFFNFIFSLVLNLGYPSMVVSLFKLTFLYKLFIFFIVLISFFIYLIFSSEAVRHKLKLKAAFSKVLNLTLLLLIVEVILVTISNFIFFKNNLIYLGVSKNLLYFLYTYLWIIIKASVLMCVFIVSYILFKKSKEL